MTPRLNSSSRRSPDYKYSRPRNMYQGASASVSKSIPRSEEQYLNERSWSRGAVEALTDSFGLIEKASKERRKRAAKIASHTKKRKREENDSFTPMIKLDL